MKSGWGRLLAVVGASGEEAAFPSPAVPLDQLFLLTFRFLLAPPLQGPRSQSLLDTKMSE